MHQLDNKVFDITDARCNHEVHLFLYYTMKKVYRSSVGKQEEERQRHRGKYIKMDRVHLGFIRHRAESSDETNLQPSLNLTRTDTCLNDFYGC